MVENLAAEADFRVEFPALDAEDGYKELRDYCDDLNRYLELTNFQYNHCFAYTLIKEPELVRNRLLELMPALRLFICVEGEEAIPVLHLEEKRLEAWVANLLTGIEVREDRLKEDGLPAKPKGDTSMSNQARDIQQHITVTAETVAIGGQQATNNQTTNSTDIQELIQLFQAIRAESDRSNPDHRQLRADVQEILDELKKEGKLPENGKGWLEDAKATLGLGDKLIGFVTKALELWSKIPGVGT